MLVDRARPDAEQLRDDAVALALRRQQQAVALALGEGDGGDPARPAGASQPPRRLEGEIAERLCRREIAIRQLAPNSQAEAGRAGHFARNVVRHREAAADAVAA